MQTSPTRIATAQISCVPGDVGANLETITRVVHEAGADGAELVVLPELALSGYSVSDHLATASVRLNSPEIDHLCHLSRRTAIAIGLIEETPDHRFFNSAMFFAGGELLHLHRKVYPPTYGIFAERKLFGVGSTLSAFDTPVGRVAMLICGDAWHPSLPYLAAHDGADLLLIMAASPRNGLGDAISSPQAWQRLTSTYALTMSFYVCFANRVGSEDNLHFTGHSHLMDPTGNVLAECAHDRSGFALGELCKDQLRAQRLNLPFRRDDRLEFVLECGQRIRQNAHQRDMQAWGEVAGGTRAATPQDVAGRIHPAPPLGSPEATLSEGDRSRWAI
ncbi:MAG: carbon-nitrogen hydrolase [Planctomycetota bacterium]|nr:MAG: carbon-nitrogen hydrolase [Planctomycetota bacterium]